MGRESVSLNSTIAMLQERFKKLERVREMREERELHRSSATTSRGAAQVGLQSSEQPKWLFPGASAPSSGQLRSSHVVDTSLTIGSWHNSDETTADVDTSLHL